MLVFNPTKRWSFDQCLQSSIFDPVRNKNLEEYEDLEVHKENMRVDFNNYPV